MCSVVYFIVHAAFVRIKLMTVIIVVVAVNNEKRSPALEAAKLSYAGINSRSK